MVEQYALVRRPVESRILFLRGRKVLLDSDLADLYRITVKRLNQQVKHNAERFPEDFMFRLRPGENKLLRSQTATSNGGRGGRRYLPFVFTEHGAIMAASVLNSPRAVEMSIFVVRAFIISMVPRSLIVRFFQQPAEGPFVFLSLGLSLLV
jgi:ORF6N domain-containing protein